MSLNIHPAKSIRGEFRAPSDKSLTHRAYMFAAIAQGPSVVRHPLRGEDCECTLRCLGQLGLQHEWLDKSTVRLTPAEEWTQPAAALDCGNSGTTMRLLSGLLASRPVTSTLVGDASLSKRPMRRIALPLIQMGAEIEGETPPLTIKGRPLKGIDYETPVPSAQIKSAVLLAGLRAEGITSVYETTLSRDHTERMLTAMGVNLTQTFSGDGYGHGTHHVQVYGGQAPNGFEFEVPGDISSAAFFMVACALLKESEMLITDVSTNPSRTGILDVFNQVGVNFQLENQAGRLNEPTADLRIYSSSYKKPFTIQGEIVPRLIDEIPVLAVLATQCEGTSHIRDAKELRVKESDRIETVAKALRDMGATVETFEDGMAITGPTPLKGAVVEASGDHRIAMAFAIAGLIASGETTILGSDSIATSFPSFEAELGRLVLR